jgi:hypothetical protein
MKTRTFYVLFPYWEHHQKMPFQSFFLMFWRVATHIILEMMKIELLTSGLHVFKPKLVHTWVLHMFWSHSPFRSSLPGPGHIRWLACHRPAMAPSTRLESKVHSCSELEKGHKKLLAVKREGNDPDEFDAKIKDPIHASFISCDGMGHSAIAYICE